MCVVTSQYFNNATLSNRLAGLALVIFFLQNLRKTVAKPKPMRNQIQCKTIARPGLASKMPYICYRSCKPNFGLGLAVQSELQDEDCNTKTDYAHHSTVVFAYCASLGFIELQFTAFDTPFIV